MNWFISDTHFNHTNIINYCNRPFSTTDEMDQAIISGINDCVKSDDTLWHLGDFMFGRCHYPDMKCISYLERINCKNIILIVGSHDQVITRHPRVMDMFQMIIPYFAGHIKGTPITMSHKPLPLHPEVNARAKDIVRVNSLEYQLLGGFICDYKGVINLHGHTHNNSHIGPYNMCVENNEYKPVSLEELLVRRTELH